MCVHCVVWISVSHHAKDVIHSLPLVFEKVPKIEVIAAGLPIEDHARLQLEYRFVGRHGKMPEKLRSLFSANGALVVILGMVEREFDPVARAVPPMSVNP